MAEVGGGSAPGGVSSVRALHATYAGPLLAFALRSVGDRQAAEEIVQDTLVRAWRSAHRFDPSKGSLDTWLFTICRNLVIDHHRRRSARPRIVATLDGAPEPATDHEELDRALESWQVARGLAALSDAHRRVIVETYYRGASVAEAAARLGIPEGTVKSRLYYGLRNLRLALEEMGAVG